MPTTKELREFFLRNVPVNTGLSRDQEAGYPTQNLINGTYKYNRFKKNNYPTEDVYTKLFESITFKLNRGDTASNTYQGLAKTATDNEVINRVATWTDGMVRFTMPIQLPITQADPSPGNVTITVTPTTSTVSGHSVKVYNVKANYAGAIPQVRVLESLFTSVGTAANGGASTQTLRTYAIAANTLSGNGDFLDVEGYLTVPVYNLVGFFTVKIGTFTIFSLGVNAGQYTTIKFRSRVIRVSNTDVISEVIADYGSIFGTNRTLYHNYLTGAAAVDFSVSQNLTVNFTHNSAITLNGVTSETLRVIAYQK